MAMARPLLLLVFCLAPAPPCLVHAWGARVGSSSSSIPTGEGTFGLGGRSSSGHGGRAVKRALYVFGDSTVDTGNNNYFTTTLNASRDPYGIDYIPRSGRFCNGRIVTDFLASYMGIPTPQPFLAHPRNTKYGVNFASSGAGILNITSENQTIPLLRQLDLFRGFVASHNLSSQELGQAVFFVSVGGNDVLDRFLHPLNAAPVPIFVAEMVTGYVRFIEALFTLGARRFLLTNVPNLGCLPVGATVRALVAPETAGRGCDPAATELSRAVNIELLPAMGALEVSLRARAAGAEQDVLISHYDTFSGLSFIHNKAQQLGFVDTFACCGAPPPTNGLIVCNTTVSIGGITIGTTLCNDHDRHVFWDLAHPSQRSHYYFAKWMWTNTTFTTPILASRLIED